MSLAPTPHSADGMPPHSCTETTGSRGASRPRCALTAAIGLVTLLCVAVVSGIGPVPSTESLPKRLSFHNRLLLNRVAVSGLRTVEVMLAVTANGLAPTSARIERFGGRVVRSDAAVGYLRATVPTEKLLALVEDGRIEAYQISSLSKASWYRDGPPQANAEMYRGFERVIPTLRPQQDERPDLPLLSVERARDSGYTANEDVGLDQWVRKHPTYDGRGVTIAIVESGLPEFTHPTLRSATTLDGRDIPKLAGILNAIDGDQPDRTRVELATEVHAHTGWQQIDDRTYMMPRPGPYRFGMFRLPAADNLIHEFPVLQDQRTRDIWVDTNGDADFRDETPVADVNDRFDVRALKLTHPTPADLPFVVARGRAPHTMHIYPSTGGHQTMTLSVAAGSRTEDGLAYGVAPAARVLLVRQDSSTLPSILESYLEAIKRPDVDVLASATGITMVPDTAEDFAGLFFRRLVAAYDKPIFNGAGNTQLWLNSATSLGDLFSVGGSLGPKTFAALYGGAPLESLMVHPVGAAGPSVDGALKPDFLAPVHRIAADVSNHSFPVLVPKNAPTTRFPPGYQISCCTSASGPYAAGVWALLVSAAKQEDVPYSVETLGRAMRVGARFLPKWPSYQQGNGVLDVNAAWRELRRDVEIPRIDASANIVHPLASYAAQGPKGPGIFEQEGWHVGMEGQRIIHLRRQSGPDRPITYRLSWTGSDGTFSTPRSLTLPLNQKVSLPVTIAVHSTGAHSALLNLHDPTTDAIIFRTQATVVAPERFDTADRTLRLSASVPLMRASTHYLAVPNEVGALGIELEVTRGAVRATVLPSHSLYPNYYGHVHPPLGRTFTKGAYHLVIPNPSAGTWTIDVRNTTARTEQDLALVSTDQAEYTLTTRLLSASLQPTASSDRRLDVDVDNAGSELKDPVLETSLGTLTRHHGELLATGLPNLFEVKVPDGASTLALQLRDVDGETDSVELYLYDCTSGECFSDNLTLPAAKEQTLVVRRPHAGRWIAAVNTAPFPARRGRFVLDEVITTDPKRHTLDQNGPRASGARWTETIPIPAPPSAEPGRSPVLLCELIDRGTERDEAEHAWETREHVPKLRDRPVAIGTAIYRFE